MNDFLTEIAWDEIARFCGRWQIRELSLSGSVLRDDFRADSDVDVLVSFADAAEWGLFDHLRMEEELAALLRRPVDLVSARALAASPNRLLREEILNTARIVFPEDRTAHAA